MAKKRKKSGNRQGLQAVTLCISTAMVLVLLGLVVFSVLTARNLSTYVKQNIVVTMMLQDDMTPGEARQFCAKLRQRPYICKLDYVSLMCLKLRLIGELDAWMFLLVAKSRSLAS